MARAKIVFMGTPEFAVPTLRALIELNDVIGVVTQPDRPAGRNQEVSPSPVKQVALGEGIPVFQPEKLRRSEAIEALRQWQADAYVVAAFGQILPQAVLDIPAYGSINVHASLLPRWRGAAPIQAAIRAGDEEAGITIMKMDAGLDTGPILSQGRLPIMPDDTGATMHDKLAQLGADLLINTLPGYLSGAIKPQEQRDDRATYAPQITKEQRRIDWTQPAEAIERKVRAFTPWPGTYTELNGKQLKIHSGETFVLGEPNSDTQPLLLFREAHDEYVPGTVLERYGRVAVQTGEGFYYPSVVQLAGKTRVTMHDFVNGHPDLVGSVLK